MTKISIETAIVSVSDKTDLDKLGQYFLRNEVEVLSTGGTFSFKKNLKIKT